MMVLSEQRAWQLGAGEIVRRGQAIYENSLRETLDTPANLGKFLAIDIDTGNYVVGGRLDASRILREMYPDAVICLLKIGYPAAVTMAGRLLPSPR